MDGLQPKYFMLFSLSYDATKILVNNYINITH